MDRRSRRRIAAALWIFLGFLSMLLLGCAYSLTGNLPGHISSVKLERFRSSATEYGLDNELTSRVTEALVSDGRLSVVSGEADARISGTVTIFDRSPYSYTASETIEEYKLTMNVSITFLDQVRDERMLDAEQVSEWIVYDPNNEAYADAKSRLLDRISEEIVRRCLSGW